MASTLLVRHAQASFGTDSYDRLSELGMRQARAAGEYLAMAVKPVARIISGRLIRQQQTAAEIAKRVCTAKGCSPDVEVDARLDELDMDSLVERIGSRLQDPSGGLARDLAAARTSSSAYQKVIRRVFAYWQTEGEQPGVESWRAFSSRAQAIARELARQSGPGDTTVAVSSGAVIAAMVHGVLGLPAAGAYPLLEALKNCSITQLLHTRQRLSLSSFNDTSYLAVAGASSGEGNLITYR